MKIFILICGTFFLNSAFAITGGKSTDPTAMPWFVQLIMEKGYCGGTIIGSRVVLTAAHCITDGGALLSIGGGGSGFIDYFPSLGRAKKIIVHPQWNTKSAISLYDIALIILADDIPFSQDKQPIKMATSADILKMDSTLATAIGTGENGYGNANSLKKVTMPLRPYFTDKEFWLTVFTDMTDEVYSEDLAPYAKSMLLMYSTTEVKGVCKGDSGSSLHIVSENNEPLLIGVAALSIGGCGAVSGFTSVPAYIDWIQETISTNLQ